MTEILCPYCSTPFSDTIILKKHFQNSHNEVPAGAKMSFLKEKNTEQLVNKKNVLKKKKEISRSNVKKFNTAVKKAIAKNSVLSPAQKRAQKRKKKKAIKHKSVFAIPTPFESNRHRH